MPQKPIFVATHPRACSTAFERVFMTRGDILDCVHEPFGDAFYYGPERLAPRFANDEKAREESGFSNSTYHTIMEGINKANTEDNAQGKRILIKDMIQYLVPPNQGPVSLAPSLLKSTTNGHSNHNGCNGYHKKPPGGKIETQSQVHNGVQAVSGAPYDTCAEKENPSVVPSDLLKQFHFAFLIRNPRNSIPSYYRCCVPPISDTTGFEGFRPDEAGYDELRRVFDYLRSIDYIVPEMRSINGTIKLCSSQDLKDDEANQKACVIDADDLLDAPEKIISTFCKIVGMDFSPKMLNWDNKEQHDMAVATFAKWKGFHDDAIDSKDLKPREGKKREKSDEEYYNEWVEKYGQDAADMIKKAVDDNMEDYKYLKQFAIEV